VKTLIDLEDNIREVKQKDAGGQTMMKCELDGFRKTLKTRQAELSAGLRKREALAIEASADELDQIQHAQERDFAMGALDRESVRLREIRAALERIDRGSFGICLNCEEEIGAKRLAAVPWTALCIVCQQVAEHIASNSQVEEEQPFLSAA
jgi:DnaK suppressor protein